MPVDGVKLALKILTKANKETVRLIQALARTLGVPPDHPPLEEVTLDVAGKQYTGLLSTSQEATVTAAGQSSAKVETALLNQISRVNSAQADALAGLQGALAAKLAKGAKPGAAPLAGPTGSCDWTDGNGEHCQTKMLQSQCNVLGGTWVQGGGCPQTRP